LKTRIKICGVTRARDAARAVDLGAWAVGVVFVPGTPRCLDAAAAERVFGSVPPSVLRAGVFMDQPKDDVRRLSRDLRLDLIQLHGSESEFFCEGLEPGSIVKTVTLAGEEDIRDARKWECGYLLVDRPREGRTAPAIADWTLASHLCRVRPKTLLAGGLTPSNAAKAVRTVRPWGIDVSSGIESAPGEKDAEKMRSFFEAVAGVEREMER